MPRKARKPVDPPKPPTRIPNVKPPPDDDDGAKPGDDGLTAQQRAFVEHITSSCPGNATEAAAKAGYRSENRDSLASTAWRLLRNVKVAGAIRERLAKAMDLAQTRRDALVMRAASSMENFVKLNDEGELETDFGKAAALGALGQIKKLKQKKLKTMGSSELWETEFEIHDGLEALKLLFQLDGKLNDDAAGGGVHLHVSWPQLPSTLQPQSSAPAATSTSSKT